MDDIIDPNASKEAAMTSLHWCTVSRQLHLLKAILSAHFSHCAISDLERQCSVVLHQAVTSGCKDTLQSLLRHVQESFLQASGDPDDKGKAQNGRSRLDKLLGLAVDHGNRDAAEVLLLKGANPNRLYRNKPLLHLSLNLGHHHIALLLVQYGADVNMIDTNGETAIFAAISADSGQAVVVLDKLLAQGADINHRSFTGRQPIHCAALTSHSTALTRVLQAGGDVSARDRVMGDTPLHLACARCCQAAVVQLVRHGADFNAVNHRGDTPLRKLLQHATGVRKDFHHSTRITLARSFVILGFRVFSMSEEYSIKCQASSPDRSDPRLDSVTKVTNTPAGGVKREKRGTGCGASQGRDKVMELFHSLYPEDQRKLGVPALQHLSRMAVRCQLPSVHFQAKVRQLELSPQLHQYLMFLPHLMDNTL